MWYCFCTHLWETSGAFKPSYHCSTSTVATPTIPTAQIYIHWTPQNNPAGDIQAPLPPLCHPASPDNSKATQSQWWCFVGCSRRRPFVMVIQLVNHSELLWGGLQACSLKAMYNLSHINLPLAPGNHGESHRCMTINTSPAKAEIVSAHQQRKKGIQSQLNVKTRKRSCS